MIRSLYAKLALALVGLFVLTGCLFAALMFYASDLYHQELSQKLSRDLAEHIVAYDTLVVNGRPDDTRLEALFQSMMSLNPSVEIYLLGPNGEILAFSAPPGKVKLERVDLQPIRQFLAGQRLPVLGDDPRRPDRRKIFSVAPIAQGGNRQCFLYVILAGEQIDSLAAMLQGSYILKLSLLGLALALAFALSAALLVFSLLTRRLRRLSAEVGELGFHGARAARPPERREDAAGDEIDQLGRSFQRMAGQLATQVEDLQEMDRMRRELVANVSHDLRTPLASLQGYLETLMLKGESLGGAERARYLRIAARHSERLGKLVSELFELARLDATSAMPEREPFSMAELVQDVVQKLELRARDAGIALEAPLDGDLPYVHANIALIERVLENLLDNALRHTGSGGRVEISLRAAGPDAVVSVSDTGHGIASADLPHIFDRFYRSKDQLRRDDDGAGLGLAIAKRIVELHGRSIRAQSVLRQGTTISFELPLAAQPTGQGERQSRPERRLAS